MSDPSAFQAVELQLAGLVQGLGIRPTIARLARDLGLCGSVRNRLDGVQVVLEGRVEHIEQFRQQLAERFPSEASLARLETHARAVTGIRGFRIIEAEVSDGAAPRTRVAPDLVVCRDCLEEIADPADRRHDYAFTSCTSCGPRFSIIERMPYERRDTAMRAFGLCEACLREYTAVDNRRYHAQTNACPRCGPHPWCVDRRGRQLDRGPAAIAAAANALRSGQIVALRGIGGYQLLVDAENEAAVQRLRRGKQRPAKPLAVMVPSLESARRLATLDQTAEAALLRTANPIVLIPARANSGLAVSIHPQFADVGLMLPSSPLHWLLLQHFRGALVATSGNVESDPLVVDPVEAEQKLAHVADVFLHHDRPVVHGIDDSVVRPLAGGVTTIRLARGLAPHPLNIAVAEPVLAVGAHQKNALAVANGSQAILGPHIGDLETLATRARWIQHVADMQTLFGCAAPRRLVHDLHPGYFTSDWVRQQSSARATGVQHHVAHVLSAMLEHEWLDREVLGVAFDGTGYGTDGTIWGGEFLRTRRDAFERVAHLRPFRLPLGETAVREPWRLAAALTAEVDGPQRAFELVSGSTWPQVSAYQVRTVLQLAGNPQFSPLTTSAGRLFDSVASLVLGMPQAQFEGQPAMLLEAICDPTASGAYDIALDRSSPRQLDWRPALRGVLADLRSGTPPGIIATRFHRSLARGIGDVLAGYPDLPAVLTGGVFQNRVLTELVLEFASDSQTLALSRAIPPNDGGIAAGQLVAAMNVG